MIGGKVSIRFSDDELLIIKSMAAKKNKTISELCRQAILYGEASEVAIRDASIQERIDELDAKIDALGQVVIEQKAYAEEANSNLETVIRKGISALAERLSK